MSINYKNPPIREALIDIRIDPVSTTTLDALQNVRTGYETTFPSQEKYIEGRVEISAGEQLSSTNEARQVGWLFSSETKQRIVQAKISGYTFNWLAPYTNWNEFRDEARFWWDKYRDVVRPERVSRVAVRYINRMDIPADAVISEYLRTRPEISPDMPQQLVAGFFMQLQMPQTDIDARLILNQSLEASEAHDKVSIILDIAVIREIPEFETESDMWDYFEQLRKCKNRVFQASITERMEELFNL